MCVVASGRDHFLSAWNFLDELARQQQIPNASTVDLYDEVRLSGRLASDLLNHLGPPTNGGDRGEREKLGPIELEREYDIYLSEL